MNTYNKLLETVLYPYRRHMARLHQWLDTSPVGTRVRHMAVPKKPYQVNIGNPAVINIILVGCGGTGSRVARLLAQLAYWATTQDQDIRLYFVDHDIVEAKNVARQDFVEAEIGYHKAATLAWRYGNAYGLSIHAATESFAADMLTQFRSNAPGRGGELTVIVGAVDNRAARRDIAEAIEAAINQRRSGDLANIWWIDAGNEYHRGQVVAGNSLEPTPLLSPLGYCAALPFPHIQSPSLVTVEMDLTQHDAALSCAELTMLGEQSAMINNTMATVVGWYLYRLIQEKALDMMATHVNLKTGFAQSTRVMTGRFVRFSGTGEPQQQRTPDLPPQQAQVAATDDNAAQQLTEEFNPDTIPCPRCLDRVLVRGTQALDGVDIAVLFCEHCDYRQDVCPRCLGEVRRGESPQNGDPAIICDDCRWIGVIPEQFRAGAGGEPVQLEEIVLPTESSPASE